MRLALAQMLVEPAKPEANLARAADRIAHAAKAGADTVLLPEVLDCGWTNRSARTMAGRIPGGTAFEKLRKAAMDNRVMVCAGLAESSEYRVYNSAVLISPEGELLIHHRKINELDFARHLYWVGDRLSAVDTPQGKVGVMICSDAFARGLAISRMLGHMGAQVILSPCAWAVAPDFDPVREPYGDIWRKSYGPVAQEHELWIAGCSNVGVLTDGEWTGWKCIGSSLVVGPSGEELVQAAFGEDADGVLMVDIPVRPA